MPDAPVVVESAADLDRRPLTARSVLASMMLGAHPQALPVRRLVQVTGLFGISENRARVALSRMVGSGEATTDGAGTYRLAGHLLARQQRQVVSRAGHSGWWAGGWHVVVLGGAATAAEVRGQRRRALEQARLGELRQGVWMRPDNVALQVDGDAVGDALLMKASPSGDLPALAAQLWDLEGWRMRAEALIAALDALSVEGAVQLAPGFVLSASVLRHFQADPLLPDQLLPSSWPGSRLRARYEVWDASYRSVLAQWNRAG